MRSKERHFHFQNGFPCRKAGGARSRGSVLITSLWALSIAAVVTGSLGSQALEHLQLMKRETGAFQDQTDFLSGLNRAKAAIAAGESIRIPRSSRGMTTLIEDEESKLNLNGASEAFLKKFLELFSEETAPFQSSVRSMTQTLIQYQSKNKIRSFEELFLLEDLEAEDLETLRPHVTVYPQTSQLNLNTAGELVLRAFVESLPGDSFAKQLFLRKIKEFRERSVFVPKDLEPYAFLQRLELPQTPQIVQITGLFLMRVTVTPQTFRIRMQKEQSRAEAVIRRQGAGDLFETLAWRES